MPDFVRPALIAIALAAGAGGYPIPAHAGEAQDRLFAVGLLDAAPTGARLVYRHTRESAGTPPPLVDGSVEIVIAADRDGRLAFVKLHEGTTERALDPLPTGGGHPLVLVFLETAVRSVAAATGGSPFYIRNRMREALAAQDDRVAVEVRAGATAGPGERLTFRPFDGDPNAAQLGAFADTTLTVDLADAAPGMLARLEIAAGPEAAPALRETMEFDRMEGF